MRLRPRPRRRTRSGTVSIATSVAPCDSKDFTQEQRPPDSGRPLHVVRPCGRGPRSGGLEVHSERHAELARRVSRRVAPVCRALEGQVVYPRHVRVIPELEIYIQGGELWRVEDVVELQLQ